MPVGIVKSPADEAKWDRAKREASKTLSPKSGDRYWALVTYIFKRMKQANSAMSVESMKAEGKATSNYAYVDSNGKGHLPIGDKAHVRNALARFGQTHFESASKARTAWSHITGAARRFGIKVSGSMPQPKIKAPSPGYKKKASALLASLLHGLFKPLKPIEPVPGRAACAIELNVEQTPHDDGSQDSKEAWVEVIPAGTFKSIDGRGPFKNSDPDAVVKASMAIMPRAGAVVDYNHATDLAAPEGRPSPAAGWVKAYKVHNGAIYAHIEWTADATESLKEKHYRYVSPVFEHDKDGEVERILRVALTNNPALTELPAIAAARSIMARKREEQTEEMALSEMMKRMESALPGASKAKLLRLAAAAICPNDDDEEMMRRMMGDLADWAKEEESEPQHEDSVGGDNGDEDEDGEGEGTPHYETDEEMAARHKEELAKAPPDKKDEMAARHKEELSKREEAAKKEEDSSRKEEASYEDEEMSKREEASKRGMTQMAKEKETNTDKEDVVRLVSRLVRKSMDNGSRKEVELLQARLVELETSQAKATAINVVDNTIKAGRLLPSQREWGIAYAAKDLEGFQSFAAMQPVLLSPGADGTFSGKIPESTSELLTAREIEICNNLGVTKESFVVARKERLSYGVHL